MWNETWEPCSKFLEREKCFVRLFLMAGGREREMSRIICMLSTFPNANTRRQATTGGARSVLLLPSINSPLFLPPYIGAIRSKKREEHQGPSAPVQDPHLPERVLG